MDINPATSVRLAAPRFPNLDLEAVRSLLGSGWLSNGPHVRAFEDAFAAWQGVPHAVAVSSCSAALHLALLGHGIGPGDEVIATAMTFAATVNAIVHAGATPVLADVDADTLNIDPASIARAITPRTKAILPVHFAGLPADIAPIQDLARRHGLAVIHDAAHAAEARYRGQPIGWHGETACFSFYATKNLPIGEGGMLTTRDPAVADAARALRSHGMTADAFQRHGGQTERWRHWDLRRPGFNYKMMDLAALLGLSQLPNLEAWRTRRAELVALYEAGLGGMNGVRLLGGLPDTVHAHHIFVIRLEHEDFDRDAIAPRLKAAGVEVSVNYRALPDLTWYRETYGWRPEDVPVATRAGRCCITLPLHPEMTGEDVAFVVETLRLELAGEIHGGG